MGLKVDEMSHMLLSATTITKKRASKAVAVVVAPFLVSEKVEGYRGELRPGPSNNVAIISSVTKMIQIIFFP